jgi:hypothetical protein
MPRRPAAARPATGPRDGEITAADAARHLHISKQGVGLWLKRPGCPVRWAGTRAYVRTPDFFRWREAELCRQAVEEATSPLRRQLDGLQAGSPAARKLAAEARLVELDVEERERSMVRVDEVLPLVNRLLTTLKKKLLAVSTDWAPALVGAQSIDDLTVRLHRLVIAELLPKLATPTALADPSAETAEESPE